MTVQFLFLITENESLLVHQWKQYIELLDIHILERFWNINAAIELLLLLYI